MYISRVVVRNFRNIEFLDIELQGGVTTIIGENNTGKTNLVHAIRLALDGDLPGYVRQLAPADVYEPVANEHAIQVVVSVEFTDFEQDVDASAFAAFLKVDEDHARLTYRFRPDAATRDSIEAGELTEEELSYDNYKWEIAGGGDKDPASIEWDDDSGQNLNSSQLSDYLVVFLHALRDAASDLRGVRNSPLRRLLRTLDIPKEERTELLQVLQHANDEVSSKPTIESVGSLLDKRLENTAGEAFRLGVSLGMASPTFSALERSLTILLSSDTHTAFEPAQNGLGLNNVLYLAIVLQYFESRMTSGSIGGSVLLIEEPEAHLHPQLEKVLVDTLAAHGVQVILTTHSSHIASYHPIDDAVVLTLNKEGGVLASTPRSNPHLDGNDRADLNRYLDATKSTLLFARRVILVEGAAELFVIPPLARVVAGVDLARLGIVLVPIHGVFFEPFAKLFGPDAIQKRCAIVTDCDDKEGADADAPPRGLEAIENEYVKVFATPSTFEKSLAIEGLLPALRATAEEFNARSLVSAIDGRDLDDVAERVLAIACDRKKGRFAQVLSRNLSSATEMPEYIARAIGWICE